MQGVRAVKTNPICHEFDRSCDQYSPEDHARPILYRERKSLSK